MLIGTIVVSCYFIGSIPFGLLIGKLNKIDIREHGSGNIGATNVLRTLGKKWGYICFILDFLKGQLPVIAAIQVTAQSNLGGEDYIPSIAIVSTVLGHVFSLFLKFKGGKGIATSAGAIMAIAPYTLIIGLTFWFIVFKMTGYVSLASILAAVAIPFLAVGSNALNLQSVPISSCSISILVLLGLLVILKHKTNILRLKNGTEPSFKKKAQS